MDQSSPEQPKPDLFDLMPDPYTSREKFNNWFEGLLSNIDKAPEGYDDQRKTNPNLTDAEIIKSYQDQLKVVVESWITPYSHPKKKTPSRPWTVEEIKDGLRGSTSRLLKDSNSPK